MGLFDYNEEKKRKSLTASQKRKLLIDAESKCQKCRKSFKQLGVRPHYHHKNGKRWEAKMSNFMIICPNCHDKLHEYQKVKVSDGWGGTHTKIKLVTKKVKKKGPKPKKKRVKVGETIWGEPIYKMKTVKSTKTKATKRKTTKKKTNGLFDLGW